MGFGLSHNFSSRDSALRLIGPITISFVGASNRPRPKRAARGSCESAEHFVLRRCLNQIDPSRFQPMDLIERFKTLSDLQAHSAERRDVF
jgi:hypothetical protein